MYRARSVQSSSSNESFVNRLYCDLPVVHSTFDKISSLYVSTKQRNPLFRFTLETAETGFGLVVTSAKPILEKFEKPIDSIHGLACDRLDKLERDYPIITKPTDVVAKEAMEVYTTAMSPITERVKPVTDKISSATQYSTSKISDAKDYTVSLVGGVKSYGVQKVTSMKCYGMNKFNTVISAGSRQVSRLFDNPAGRAVITKIDVTIEIVDSYVEKYLPGEESDEQKSSVKADELDGKETEQQVMVFHKFMELGGKVRRRLSSRVVKRHKLIKTRSLETIERLHFKTDLIELGRSYFHEMCGKISTMRQLINKSSEQVNAETINQEQTGSNLVQMVSVPVVASVTKAGSMMVDSLRWATRTAWYDVTKLTDLISSTWTRSLGKPSHGSEMEEIQKDTNNSEQYEEHSCERHDNSTDNSSD